MAANYGLHAGSLTPDFIQALDQVYKEMQLQRDRIQASEAQLAGRCQQYQEPKKERTDTKSFQSVPNFDGSEKSFKDWGFKLQRFVRPFPEMEASLELIKEQDLYLTAAAHKEKADAVQLANHAVNVALYDDQLHGVLTMLCTDNALTTVKNQQKFSGA